VGVCDATLDVSPLILDESIEISDIGSDKSFADLIAGIVSAESRPAPSTETSSRFG